MDFEYEEAYIGTKKNQFKSLFGVPADENLQEFLMYLTDVTNRDLRDELNVFNKHINSLKEDGFFEKLLEN